MMLQLKAQLSRGVDTYCKDSATPFAAEEGLTGLLTTNHKMTVECYGDQEEFSSEEQYVLDNEGRAVLTQHRGEKRLLSYDLSHDFLYFKKYCNGKFQLVMVIPRADPEKPEWKLFELQFYKLLQCRGTGVGCRNPLPVSQEAGETREYLNPLRARTSSGKKRTLAGVICPKKSKPLKAGPKPQGSLLAFFKPKSTLVSRGFWKTVLRGPSPCPPVRYMGTPFTPHSQEGGPNFGKQFFVCNRPQGHASNPEACCSFFSWVDNKGK
eukprot:XP_013991925.1 PREDICTED: DNA-(apurinic or apyrimidinic site) lyase 2-like [Salmo salar]